MLLPALRPWHRAGVEFLLAEQPLPAPWSLCIAAAPSVAGQRVEGPRSGQAPRIGQAPRSGQALEAGPVPHRRPEPAPAVSGAPAASNPSFDPQAPGKSAVVPALALNLWPSPWQERLKKTAPAAVLWTYWTLGEDLCSRPNPARRTLLQRLLADLGHPAGTHSFWPPALPCADSDPAAECALQANPEVFWSGVQALKARALVVMGSPAIKALDLPPRLRPFQQTRHKGQLIVVLRDVDFLAQETHRYDAVREFLKQALAPFGR